MVALLLLAFVVGVQVGKVMTPTEGEVVAPDVATADRTIAEILDSYQRASQVTPVPADAAAGDGADAQADLLQVPEPTEPPTPAEVEIEAAPPPPPIPFVPPPIPQVPQVELPEPSTPAELEIEVEDVDADSAVEEPPPPTDPIAELPRPSGVGAWEVQLASWPTAAEAEQMVQRLDAAGIRSYRVSAEVRGQTWHRVRVGRFGSRDAATAWLEPLTDFTPYAPIVVND